MQARQIGVPQVHREVVARHRVVEIHQSEEVEVQIGVAGRDQAVELPVAQTAVQPQRVVDIAVEAQPGDVAHDVGVGHALADHAIDIGRERGVAQQIAAVEQVAQPQVARLDIAPHAAQAPFQRRHPQVAGHVAHLGRGPQLHVERRELPLEAGIEVDAPRVAEYPDQPVRELAPGDAEGQPVHRLGRRVQAGHREVEPRVADLRQPLHRGVGHERRALADVHAPDLGREIRHHARDLDVYIAEIQMPVAQPGSEPRDVVGRDRRVAQRGVDAHLPEKILVFGPRVADQRDIGNPDVGTRGDDRGVLEAQTPLRHVETPREVVQH